MIIMTMIFFLNGKTTDDFKINQEDKIPYIDITLLSTNLQI